MSKARHRRPSKTARVVASTTPAAVAAGMLLTGSSAAHAQTVAPAHPKAHSTTVVNVNPLNKARLFAEQARAIKAHPAAITTVTVQAGQYLSLIASNDCGTASDWPAIYERNKSTIGGNPNFVTPGEQLVLDCRRLSAGVVTTAHADPPAHHSGRTWDVSYGYPNYCGDGDGDGWDVNCSTRDTGNTDPAPVAQVVHHSSAGYYSGNVSPSGYSGMQQCIISRESGGNSQVMNSSGHYGLYQFSSSTWAAHGGNPADFGHASVAEQNQVYQSTVAADGYSDWAPYDGCLHHKGQGLI